ncbi:MAG TPA: VCBS repeat-containing protein, partial [Mucilaginibacter sp.]|nr:VCBS repeat-containing protein [Mucilaginibacter sp.]
LADNALPINHTSKLCVRAIDYNRDGKLDLFISGRVDPWHYPKPVSSMILRNDSKDGHAKFTDVINEVAPALKNIGLVCDALFTDYDNDGWPDLVLAGEWMPITFLKNEHGVFKNATAASGLAGKTGWWNSVVAGDFRHTGRMDYIVGNVGQNTLFKASERYPVYLTAKDFDKNGSYNAITSIFLPDKNGEKKEFPAVGREDMLKELISVKKKFTNYKSYAVATMDEILTPEQKKGALRLMTNTSQSCYLRNEGNGKFTCIPLPNMAQISVLNGMVVDDFDGDGNLDVMINGNDFGTEVGVGRYDALNGLMLKGDGKGNFKPQSILQSGIYIPGNGKALVKLQSNSGNYILVASQHRDTLRMFELKRKVNNIRLLPDDESVIITYKNGLKQKQEVYYGSSFLSQSGRFITVNNDAKQVQITNSNGRSRSISFN